MGILYARYGDILTGDTVSVTAGTEDTSYPKEQIADLKSRSMGKFTGSSGTYRRTFGASKTPAAAIFLNSTATAIQLTNNAGLNLAVTIPSTPEDGLVLDPWLDLRGAANGTATQWNAALSGPTGVGVGEFLLVSSLRALYALWSPVVEDERHPVIHHETEAGVALDYGLGVRQRRGRLRFRDEDGRAQFITLERYQRGRLRPWVLIPNDALNDAMLVLFDQDGLQLQPVGGSPTTANAFVTDVDVAVVEQQKGLAP